MPSLPFDESNTFTPPSAFGPYRVLHQIGSGVLGPVFRTYDPQSDRLVAVKAFRLDLLPEDVARLAEGLRRLVGAVGNLAAGLEGTTAYLAMEYHGAETLDVAMRHLAPASLDVALPLLKGIATAIDAAWANGAAYGHGALHPRDVFVTPTTNDVSVTGFGVAPALEAISARPPVRRPYTAPERAAGSAWDVRADVYSLGAIAHELLTGRRPAGPGQQDGTLPTAMAPEVRVQIRRILSKALAEHPAQRYASAGELIEALADPSSATEIEPMEPTVPAAVVAQSFAVDPVAVVDPQIDEAIADTTEPVEVTTAAQKPPARRRPRVATPAGKSSPVVNAAVTTPIEVPEPMLEAAHDIGNAPLHSRAEPNVMSELKGPMLSSDRPPSSLMLPPPFPWVATATVLVAGLVLGAVAMRTYDTRYLTAGRSVTTPSASSPVATTGSRPAITPSTPAAGDTEVTVQDAATAKKGSETPAPDGRLSIKTTPAGAAVAIDGKSVGVTPITVSDLTTGVHNVTVSHGGYTTETRRITLTNASPSATLQLTLKADRVERQAPAPKPASTGGLNVDSRPKGARVTIDGRSVGTTPFSVSGLKPGAHAVRVELAGHKPLATTVVVKAGETTKLAVTLELR